MQMIGITEFYKKVLPSKGVYCLFTLDPKGDGRPRHKYTETIDELEPLAKKLTDEGLNVFITPSTFKDYRRGADNAEWVKSLYLDMDVGPTKEYASKQEAIDSLETFIQDVELPPPVYVDSGNGIHAYWVFQQDIPAMEWKTYAVKFKDLCQRKGLKFDAQVTAELARVMRAPGTLNYKSDPPKPTKVLTDIINLYDFEQFKDFLGKVEPSLNDILKQARKGLTEEERQMMGLTNFESSFKKILEKSQEGQGCQQIKHLYENQKDTAYDLWVAGLTVASKCSDAEEAIHEISKGHPGYSPEATIAKANSFESVHSCESFAQARPGGCDGCPHRGRITNPLAIGKVFKIAKQPNIQEHELPATQEPSPLEDWEDEKIGKVIYQEKANTLPNLYTLPESMFPFVSGADGGIYKMMPNKIDPKTGAVMEQTPALVCKYKIKPIKRVYNNIDGACFVIRANLPKDPEIEFILPMKFLHSQDKLNEIMHGRNILIDPGATKMFTELLIKWGHTLSHEKEAEIMRTQMGWVDKSNSTFIWGNKEISKDSIKDCTYSITAKSVAQHLVQQGSYEEWQKAANRILSTPSMELHGFAILAGFGSPLMQFTGTRGGTVTLTGDSGAAKSGAVFTALSVWGDPEPLHITGKKGATDYGLVGRYLTSHSIPFVIDEIGDMPADKLSDIIHKIASGKARIKMQASVNAEREYEQSASLIGLFTSNHSIYGKLSALKNDPNGEVARLIEFELGQPKILLDNPTYGKEVFGTISKNFGWAGPEFIKALVKYDQKELEDRLAAVQLRFMKDFGANAANRFYENLISCIYVAGEICVENGILEHGPEPIYQKVLEEMKHIKDNIIQINKIDVEGLISNYINMHTMNILAIKDGTSVIDPKGPLLIRSEVNTKKLLINRKEFNKYLIEQNVNTKTFKEKAAKANITITEKRRRLNADWKDAGIDDYNVWCYIFDRDSLKPIEGITDE